MHSSPSTALKPTPARSESAKPTSKATAAASAGRRTSSLTSSSELPRPPRRHSAQVAAYTRQADKENAPVVDKPALDNSKAGGGGLEKPQELATVKIEMSTSSNATKTKISTAAAATALKPKSSNAKAFQSTVSPLMHFDEPAPLPTALFSGLAISGGVSPSQDVSSSATRSFSGPAALQQQQYALSANYAAQESGYLSVPTSPVPFYNPGFGVSPAAVCNPAAAAYYYPTDFSAFFYPQSYAAPSPPGTPLSTSTGAIPPSSSGTTTGTTTGNNSHQHQQQQQLLQLYPPSLGLGRPYWYGPATTTPSSANTSLSLSSVAASSLGLSPGNSRSTSATSVASAGEFDGANKVANTAAAAPATSAAIVYPIPYAYSTPFVAATAVPAAPPPRGEETTTIRERLEGGAVLSSKGACKFFDVEKVSRCRRSLAGVSLSAEKVDRDSVDPVYGASQGFGFIIDDHAEELGADG